MAAVLDSSRHAATDSTRCRHRTAWRCQHSHQPSPQRLVGDIRWRRCGFHRQGHRQAHGRALLIAADGIHSAVREKLYPLEGPPIWNGRILWRGITESDAFLSARTMIMAGHVMLNFV